MSHHMHNPSWDDRYEIRNRHERYQLYGKLIPDYGMSEDAHVVVDRAAREEGNYNHVVAAVTSVEAAHAALRLLGADTKLEKRAP